MTVHGRPSDLDSIVDVISRNGGGRILARLLGLIGFVCIAAPAALLAQEDGPLAVGVEAPDFELQAATRFGVLRDPVRLSDFRGKTVVVAFFYRVRTPG